MLPDRRKISLLIQTRTLLHWRKRYGLWTHILVGSNRLKLKMCFLQTRSFCLLQMITDGLWIIVMFLSDSHSDGTHSLPLLRHWDTFLQTWWRNKLILICDDLRVSVIVFSGWRTVSASCCLHAQLINAEYSSLSAEDQACLSETLWAAPPRHEHCAAGPEQHRHPDRRLHEAERHNTHTSTHTSYTNEVAQPFQSFRISKIIQMNPDSLKITLLKGLCAQQRYLEQSLANWVCEETTGG